MLSNGLVRLTKAIKLRPLFLPPPLKDGGPKAGLYAISKLTNDDNIHSLSCRTDANFAYDKSDRSFSNWRFARSSDTLRLCSRLNLFSPQWQVEAESRSDIIWGSEGCFLRSSLERCCLVAKRRRQEHVCSMLQNPGTLRKATIVERGHLLECFLDSTQITPRKVYLRSHTAG